MHHSRSPFTISSDRDTLSDDSLVRLVRSGDVFAVEVLLRRYASYARSKAKTYFLLGADREDIVQEGMIGLFKAIRDFDPDRETEFRSFAEMCITRQVITAVKAATRRKHAALNSYVSLHGEGNAMEGERHLGDSMATSRAVDPVELVVSSDGVEQIRSFLGQILSDLEAQVLGMYLAGRSYQDIAMTLDRHPKSVDNALQRIKRKLEGFLHRRERDAETAGTLVALAAVGSA